MPPACFLNAPTSLPLMQCGEKHCASIVWADTPRALVPLRFTALVVRPYNGLTIPCRILGGGVWAPRPTKSFAAPLSL